MPLNDYQGSKCDQLFSESSTETFIPCPCGDQDCLAEWIVLPLHLRSRHQQLAGYVYYTDAHGNVYPAGRTNESYPADWMRCEAKTLPEMYALERRMTRQEMDKREVWMEGEQRQSQETIATMRRELRTQMEQGFYAQRYDDRGNPTHKEWCEFSEKGKDFAKEMMRRNDNHRGIYDKRVSPNVTIRILHYDEGK